MPRSPQRVDQVAEVLEVAALVGADRHGLDVLLDGGVDDLLDRAVVPEVDDLGPLGLEDPPHDVDGGVVAVEQRRGGDHPHGVGGDVEPGAGHVRVLRGAGFSAENTRKSYYLTTEGSPGLR